MRFEQALQAMREGKIVHETDSDWYYEMEECRIFMWDSALVNYRKKEAYFNQDEILAEDWEVLENE